mmetsp:Transcript_48050/g.112304  ORF Transcript_48050/g.112304 Transcript_48050/m.112304 type:complete len:326 (-) Transcript_48050:11-988(-)
MVAHSQRSLGLAHDGCRTPRHRAVGRRGRAGGRAARQALLVEAERVRQHSAHRAGTQPAAAHEERVLEGAARPVQPDRGHALGQHLRGEDPRRALVKELADTLCTPPQRPCHPPLTRARGLEDDRLRRDLRRGLCSGLPVCPARQAGALRACVFGGRHARVAAWVAGACAHRVWAWKLPRALHVGLAARRAHAPDAHVEGRAWADRLDARIAAAERGAGQRLRPRPAHGGRRISRCPSPAQRRARCALGGNFAGGHLGGGHFAAAVVHGSDDRQARAPEAHDGHDAVQQCAAPLAGARLGGRWRRHGILWRCSCTLEQVACRTNV